MFTYIYILKDTYKSYVIDCAKNIYYAFGLFLCFYFRKRTFNSVFLEYIKTLDNLLKFKEVFENKPLGLVMLSEKLDIIYYN